MLFKSFKNSDIFLNIGNFSAHASAILLFTNRSNRNSDILPISSDSTIFLKIILVPFETNSLSISIASFPFIFSINSAILLLTLFNIFSALSKFGTVIFGRIKFVLNSLSISLIFLKNSPISDSKRNLIFCLLSILLLKPSCSSITIMLWSSISGMPCVCSPSFFNLSLSFCNKSNK